MSDEEVDPPRPPQSEGRYEPAAGPPEEAAHTGESGRASEEDAAGELPASGDADQEGAGHRWVLPRMVESLGERLAGSARAHPNRAVFIVGALLFAAGLVGVVGGQVGSDAVRRMLADVQGTPSPPPAEIVVGPLAGEAVEPYVVSKRNLLAERVESDPGVSTLALIVFVSYRTAGEVEQFLAAHGLSGLAAQVRPPVPGVQPAHVPLVNRSLAEAAVWQADAIDRELAVLEQVAAEADRPEYRAIYGRQLEQYRQAAVRLDDPAPATIFAAVTHATYQTLDRAAGDPQVRYVDVPVDPTVALQDVRFSAVIPEDVDRATFGP